MEKRNGFTTAEKKLTMLPDETQEGLKITGKTVLILKVQLCDAKVLALCSSLSMSTDCIAQ